MAQALQAFQLYGLPSAVVERSSRTAQPEAYQMPAALGLRPVCEASPPMAATAIVNNLDLTWLEEELLHHTWIAKDSLEGLHRRFAARVKIFAQQFLSI